MILQTKNTVPRTLACSLSFGRVERLYNRYNQREFSNFIKVNYMQTTLGSCYGMLTLSQVNYIMKSY